MTAAALDSGALFDVFVGVPILLAAVVFAILWANRELGRELDRELERLDELERERRVRS